MCCFEWLGILKWQATKTKATFWFEAHSEQMRNPALLIVCTHNARLVLLFKTQSEYWGESPRPLALIITVLYSACQVMLPLLHLVYMIPAFCVFFYRTVCWLKPNLRLKSMFHNDPLSVMPYIKFHFKGHTMHCTVLCYFFNYFTEGLIILCRWIDSIIIIQLQL